MTIEGQARHLFPAFRVFIFGIEVTEDVISVSVTHSDARAPAVAEIVLVNKDIETGIDDRYIITEEDIKAMRPEPNVELVHPETLTYVGQHLAKLQAMAESEAKEAQDALQLEKQALGPLAPDVLESSIAGLADKAAQVAQDLRDTTNDRKTTRRELTEAAFDDIHRRILEDIDRVIQDPIKQLVCLRKVFETQDIPEPDDTFGGEELKATIDNIAAFRGVAYRYPFQVGDCIFHSNDPVRIFFRDPKDPAVWYYMFAGFVSVPGEDVDENNEKTVTLRCEDVLRSFRYARISTSPGLIDIDAISVDTDLILRTFFNDDFSDFTLPEFLFSMIFGFNAAGTVTLGQETGNILNIDDISGLRTKRLISANMAKPVSVDLYKDAVAPMSVPRSLICILGQSDAADPTVVDLSRASTLTGLEVPVFSLGVYQAIVEDRVRATDLKSMAVEATGVDPITVTEYDPVTRQTSIPAVITAIGEHPEIYPVDGGRFVMLAPATMGIGYNLGVMFQDFKGVELKSSLKNRLQRMYDTLEHLEFSLYANGRGDILAEMPLHDFDPQDFGDKEVTAADLAKTLGDKRAKTMFDSSHTAGPYAPAYHVARRDTIRWSRSLNDEQIRTLVVSNFYNIPKLEAGLLSDAIGAVPARRLLPSLLPLFGVRMEQVPPTVQITDRGRAELYCQLMLNRFNGDARQAQVEIIPSPCLRPNRPLLFTERDFVGTTREVMHTIRWGERGDMSMRVKVNYIRGWDGAFDPKTGRHYYSYLGGYRANPMDYALLLHNQKPAESAALLQAASLSAGEEEG